MGIHIRKASIKDIESVLSLSDYLTLSDLQYDKDVDIQWTHTDKGKEYYSKRISGKNGICFVAEDHEKIVGYITAAIKEVPSYRLVKIAELENLFVDKKMRSKGIGKALLNYFIKWAKEIDADRASVNVFTSNEKGVAFYKREGFIPYDTILELPLKSKTK